MAKNIDDNIPEHRRIPMTPIAAEKAEKVAAAKEAEEEATPLAGSEINKANERVPFGTVRLRLTGPQRKGFVQRYFNDINEGDRIRAAHLAGYTMVNDPRTGKPISHPVGPNPHSSGRLQAFLMEIPQEFYDADFAAKQEAIDTIQMDLYRGLHNQEADDRRYVPGNAPNAIKEQIVRGAGR